MSVIASVPMQNPVLSLRDLRLYGFVAVFTAGNLIAPMAVHSIPQGGLIFLPIFFFTLVAAYRFGFTAGALTGLASPVLNFTLTGMPPSAVLPTVLVQSLLIAAIAAVLAARSGRLNPWLLLVAAISMQLAGFGFDLARGGTVSAGLDALRLGIPGVALMGFGGYAVLRLLDRAGVGVGRNEVRP
ncbi:MAG TPA: hypothetical protein VF337_09795 [Candidatus Limnocylindrales bacterium]